MTCVLLLTISVLGSTFTVERDYTGRLVSIDAKTYIVDFSTDSDWLKTLAVPKNRCVKAD